ncbi:serine hydrolase domain-containing protein [Arcticibacter tournemirensis]
MKFNKTHLSSALPFFLIMLMALTSFGFSCSQPGYEWLEQMKNAEKSTVLLNNSKGGVPLLNLADNKIASVNMGYPYATEFDSVLNKYTDISRFSSLGYSSESPDLDRLSFDLKLFNTVIIQTPGAVLNDIKSRTFIRDLEKSKQVILVLFGNPTHLAVLDSIECPIIWSAQSSPVASSFTAQLIFGGTAASAKLAVDVSQKHKRGDGFSTVATRLKYSVPEDAGINSTALTRIDDVVKEAINKHATPGAVVMVVKDGKVIFDKAYGHHTYGGPFTTKLTDIFDLASVTKIAATTMAAMRLYEQQKLRLDTNIGAYIPLARGTNKNNLTVRELMLHEAGLVPYIPFHNSIKPDDFSRDSSALFPVKVADNYYIRKGFYEDIMLPRMLSTGLRQRGKYEYSDLSMYFMKEIVEGQTSEKLNEYVFQQFYKPLGMQTAGFNPRMRFDTSRIVPTENDTYFRKTLLQGYVHDQGAALAGGVAGHAGVFSSANDLAILFQMMLNGGTYGGQQYLQSSTISMFTSRQSNTSRRGLGFDRWDPDRTNRYPSELASPETYGHTGFTGTCVWVDPRYNLIYIFLSNRLNDQPANKLSSLRIRPRIQDIIYEAIQNTRVSSNR